MLEVIRNSHTVVHLFDNATQDAVTSNAILLDTLKKLHEINPMLKKHTSDQIMLNAFTVIPKYLE